MKFFRKTKKDSGFMTLEVLIASAIIVVVILSATFVAQKAVKASRQALHTEQAAFLLEEGAEIMRLFRDEDWNSITGLTPGTPYHPVFIDPSWTITSVVQPKLGVFDREIVIADVYRDDVTGDIVTSGGTLDPGTKFITVTVSWSEDGTNISKTLSFYLADIFS